MSTLHHFSDQALANTFAQHGLDTFSGLWKVEIPWFEPPNYRRGGWSGVGTVTFEDNNQTYFIKKQENHTYRNWQTFFQKKATFYREYLNILMFNQYAIPSLALVYYGEQAQRGRIQSVLITKALTSFSPLDDAHLMSQLSSDIKLRKAVIQAIAAVVARMHAHGIQHSCLYPKHIFVNIHDPQAILVRLIDLEKAKTKLFKSAASKHDLSTLFRHSHAWRNTDKMRFYLAYKESSRLSSSLKKTLVDILKKRKRNTL